MCETTMLTTNARFKYAYGVFRRAVRLLDDEAESEFAEMSQCDKRRLLAVYSSKESVEDPMALINSGVDIRLQNLKSVKLMMLSADSSGRQYLLEKGFTRFGGKKSCLP